MGVYFSMKHSFEEKVQIIKLIEQGCSINSLCKQFSIDRHQVEELFDRYKIVGESAATKKKSCNYTVSEKIKIVQEHIEKGLTLQQTCLRYDISRSSIKQWLRDYRKNKCQEVKQRFSICNTPMTRPKKNKPTTELEKLQYENLRLRAEIDLLKKVKALVEERERRQKEIGRKPSAD